MKNDLLICSKCKWCHFGVSLDYVENQVKEFNTYYDTLSKEKQKSYYGGKKSGLDGYLFCFNCRSFYTKMKKAKKSEIPNGSTIQPILDYRNDGRK